MRALIAASLLIIAASTSWGESAEASQETQDAISPEKPAPQLVALEKLLTERQQSRDAGILPPEQYQQFVAKFRTDLESLMPRIPPTPVNQGLHALILSRLGEPDRAVAVARLAQNLEANPGNPELLRAQGHILYEQRDFPGAAGAARQSWEASGQKDKAAWALLKMSEGRVVGTPSSPRATAKSPAPAQPAALDWSIPKNPDISPQAMGHIQKAIATRKQGDLAATWASAQAAMNADPTSKAVQKFYEAVRSKRIQTQETHALIQNAVQALGAGHGEEAIAWAQKAYERSPGEDTKTILEDVQRRSASLKSALSAALPATPIRSANFLGGFLHYLGASATPRRVNFSDIDTSSVRVEDFPEVAVELKKPALSEQVKIRASRPWSTSGAQGLLIGNFTLLLKGTLTHYSDCRWSFDGSLRAFDDKYDFNKGARQLTAEALTTLGRMTPGQAYRLEIRGVRKITASGRKENCK